MTYRSSIEFLSKRRFWAHFLFWSVHILVFSAMEGASSGNTFRSFLRELVTTPVEMIQVYFAIYFLLPKYLQHQKYLPFIAGMIVTFGIGLAIFHMVNYFFIVPILFNTQPTRPFFSFNPNILWMVFVTTYLTALAGMIKLTKIWQANERRAQQVLNDKLEAELKYLKAQIHPHFLFNTLNNLYTLALKKSDKAPEAIEKLAGLLRYMTYDANQEMVNLANDLENIKNYISLEKIRYGDRLKVSLNIIGDLTQKKIAPLILLPFIENSFKHGVSGEISNSWIKINIEVQITSLTMVVENSVAPVLNDEKGYTHGIGLKNVVRRLEIMYSKKYTLKLSSDKNHLAYLKLALS